MNCIRTSLTLSRTMWRLATLLLATVISQGMGNAAEPERTQLETRFTKDVAPFLKSYCFDCHGAEKQEGKLDLSRDATVAAVIKNFRVWDIVVERLSAEEMPPQDSPKQPSAQLRQSVIDWAKAVRDYEADRHAGDPGPVLARRLSNAEYDNTIRDLTGVDIHPTREFPVDPANEAGFDNSGESLSMSPAFVKKYLAAARLVSDHAVLTIDGLRFAPHPAVTETDRDKYCVQQIVEFYQRHEVDLADYFQAAWRFQHREALGKPTATLDQFAREINMDRNQMRVRNKSDSTGNGNSPQLTSIEKAPLSSKYLAIIRSALTEPEAIGPMVEIQAEWKGILNDKSILARETNPDTTPPSKKSTAHVPPQEDNLRQACEQLRDRFVTLRKELDTKVEKLHVKGNSDGSQPLILWWNRQIASQRMSYSGDGKDAILDAARSRFCRVFPNAFSVSSRGHYNDPNLGSQLRLLTAGFHLMQGYFRDDEPLRELVLNDVERLELDALWQNLNFVTLVPLRQYKDFLFFERAESPRFAGTADFDFARPEDKDVISESKLQRMCEAYVANARKQDHSEQAVDAIKTYFENMSTDFRWIEKTRLAAEPRHVEALLKFAERAARRPLSSGERTELVAFYRSLRVQDGLNHDDAIRDSIASILMSPHFCFRFDLAAPGQSPAPLNDYELASRLSYFLWSSMPDDELLQHAARPDLRQSEVLKQQVQRMLRDSRIRGLATEFAGNWLEFRRFEEHNGVDRERFAAFTNELRQAMYEEPIRFFIDLVGRNGSLMDFLDSDHTFVNAILARHYGIELNDVADSGIREDGWMRVDHVRANGRGGLPAMSVFLTKNSPGLRTSPVKRGYWIVRRLLGEHIPAPPATVAELPKDEASLGELTLPQLLARHRADKSCAGCHQRFDSIGLVFEGYGPIGERRERDLGGHPIDATATFPNGKEGSGIEGLRRYLAEDRRDDFIDSFSRKLLAYALGRSLIPSDKKTLEQMRTKLTDDEYRFECLIETIVTSPQFLNKRAADQIPD